MRLSLGDLAWALVLAVAGVLAVLVSTPDGPGLAVDSVAYIRAARQLGEGIGLAQLGTHWPPGYPLLLNLASSVTGSELAAARWLSAVSLGASLSAIYLYAAGSNRGSRASYLATLLSLALLLNAAGLLPFLFALSEGPFVASLCWVMLAGLWLGRGQVVGIAALVLIVGLALMFLLRYAAAPLALGVLLAMAIQRHREGRRYVVLVASSAVLAVLPLIMWLLHAAGGDGASVRELGFHPPAATQFLQLFATLDKWVGGRVPWLGLVVYLAVLLTAIWRWWEVRSYPLAQLLLLHFAYLGFLLLSLTFVDAHTLLDERIMLPLFPAFLLLFAVVAGSFVGEDKGVRVEAGVLLGLVAVLLLGLPAANNLASQSRLVGLGFADRNARGLPVYLLAASIERHRPVYGNSGEILYLYHEREVLPLPRLIDPLTREFNEEFESQMNTMVFDMQRRRGVLLWVESAARARPYLPTPDLMLEHFPLEVLMEAPGGLLLAPEVIRPPPSD